jgi:hypothetical protein
MARDETAWTWWTPLSVIAECLTQEAPSDTYLFRLELLQVGQAKA